jgi:hypothetical protein
LKRHNCPPIKIYDLEIGILPKDTFLYRTGQLYNDIRPVWFGSKYTAEGYKSVRKNHQTMRFKTKRDLKLFIFNKKNILKLYKSIEHLLDDKKKKSFKDVVFIKLSDEEQSIVKSRLVDKKHRDEIFRFVGFPEKQFGIYYSLALAKIICSLGFDGWYIQPNTIIQKTNLHYNYEEFMLCNYNSVLIRL